MPWYEPSTRPPSAGKLFSSRLSDGPPNPHHRACDEALARQPDDDEVDISPYIDEQWSYPKRNSSEEENYRDTNGDRLQFRVEQHLRNMFPSFAGCFSNNRTFGGNDRFQFGGDNFFSPLVATDNSEQIGSERVMLSSTAVDQNGRGFEQTYSNTGPRQHNFLSVHHHQGTQGDFTTNEPSKQDLKSQNTQSYRNSNMDTAHATSKHDANTQSKQLLEHNHAYAAAKDNGSVAAQQKPRDLFQVKENVESAPTITAASPFVKLFNSAKRTPPVQSTLTQNTKTGKLGYSNYLPTPSKAKTKTWDDFGTGKARAASTTETMGVTKKMTRQRKGASEKAGKVNNRTRDKEGQSEIETLLESMHTSSKGKPSEKRQSDPIDGVRAKKAKQTSLSDTTPAQPVPIKSNKKSATISIEDFEGLENIGILNAASDLQALEHFLTFIRQQKHATWTMLFLDKLYSSNDSNAKPRMNKKKKKKKSNVQVQKSGKFDLPQEHQGFQITTSFLPTSKKYCTEKGPPCSSWNCTCDKQIRAKRSMAVLLGAMFLVRDEETNSMECFILPLGPTNDERCKNASSKRSPIYSRMENWPSTPFVSEVPLKHRWAAFKAILSVKMFTLVTYNATVSLLPLYHHLIHDNDRSKIDTDEEKFNECMDYLSDTTHEPLAPDECLYSIWDMRLVAWMLRPNATDSELEFSCIKEGFAHFVNPTDQYEGEIGMMARGLLETKNNLVLLSKIYPIMNEQLVRNDLLPALEQIEAPVQSILAAMECRGIAFYPKRLQSAQSQIENHIGQLEEKARLITKDSNFLLSSPQQCSKFIFDVLKLSMPDGLVTKTKAGSNHRSTSEEALKSIKAEMISTDGKSHPFIDIVLEFRHFNKILSTYILPLPMFSYKEQDNDEYPKIHPQWMQTAARTGRLSCRKPNLQQVPKSSQVVDPRKAFVPSGSKKENVLFACDYSQKEVRILAHMCQDQALISLFTGDNNVDIYKQMASLIRNKPIGSVTSDERAQFKQVTLAILYGMSPKQVAKKLNISEEAAKRMMIDFFRKFSTLKRWMDGTKAFAREHHYVKTIAGRKRYLDNINSDDRALKGQAERQAINTVIQGSAADMMKTAMLNMAENLRHWKGPVKERPKMLLQIHDELVLEMGFDQNHITLLKEIAIKSCCRDCEQCFGLTVPLILDCTCGLSWQSMKPLASPKG